MVLYPDQFQIDLTKKLRMNSNRWLSGSIRVWIVIEMIRAYGPNP